MSPVHLPNHPGLDLPLSELSRDMHPDLTQFRAVIQTEGADELFDKINNLLHEARPLRAMGTLPDRLLLMAISDLCPKGMPVSAATVSVAAGRYLDEPSDVSEGDLRAVIALIRDQLTKGASIYTVRTRVDRVPMSPEE